MRSRDAFRRRSGEQRIAMQHRHNAIGEQTHVQLALLVWHAAIGEIGDQVVGPRERAQLRDLLDAVIGRAETRAKPWNS